MSYLYGRAASEYKDNSNKVKERITKLPQATSQCKESESCECKSLSNGKLSCSPSIISANDLSGFAADGNRAARTPTCIGSDGKLDSTCSCRASSSCLKPFGSLPAGMVNQFVSPQAQKTLESFTAGQGSLPQGSGIELNKLSAFAKKNDDYVSSPRNLEGASFEQAEKLKAIGISPKSAFYLASYAQDGFGKTHPLFAQSASSTKTKETIEKDVKQLGLLAISATQTQQSETQANASNSKGAISNNGAAPASSSTKTQTEDFFVKLTEEEEAGLEQEASRSIATLRAESTVYNYDDQTNIFQVVSKAYDRQYYCYSVCVKGRKGEARPEGAMYSCDQYLPGQKRHCK